MAAPGEGVVVLVVVMVGEVVDHVGGRGGVSLETWEAWEDCEAVGFGDIGGKIGWVVSRGPGQLTE